MEDNMKDNTFSFYSVETMMAREERHIKRLVIVLAITIIMLFASNAAWLYAWMQYDYSSEEITAEQDGAGINIVGGDSVRYGADSYNPQKAAQEERQEITRNEKETE